MKYLTRNLCERLRLVFSISLCVGVALGTRGYDLIGAWLVIGSWILMMLTFAVEETR